MHRRRYLAALGTTVVTLGSGCAERPHGDGIDFQNGNFEDGPDHWVPGRDVPEDPNTGEPVANSITSSTAQASDGSRSVSLSIDGRQDDGTIWVQQQAKLGDVDRLAFDVYSPVESFNTITKVAAYVSPNPAKHSLRATLTPSARWRTTLAGGPTSIRLGTIDRVTSRSVSASSGRPRSRGT